MKNLFNSSSMIMYSVLGIIVSITIRVMVFNMQDEKINVILDIYDWSITDIFSLCLLYVSLGIFVFMIFKWVAIKIFKL
jgi:hypothetical protein